MNPMFAFLVILISIVSAWTSSRSEQAELYTNNNQEYPGYQRGSSCQKMYLSSYDKNPEQEENVYFHSPDPQINTLDQSYTLPINPCIYEQPHHSFNNSNDVIYNPNPPHNLNNSNDTMHSPKPPINIHNTFNQSNSLNSYNYSIDCQPNPQTDQWPRPPIEPHLVGTIFETPPSQMHEYKPKEQLKDPTPPHLIGTIFDIPLSNMVEYSANPLIPENIPMLEMNNIPDLMEKESVTKPKPNRSNKSLDSTESNKEPDKKKIDKSVNKSSRKTSKNSSFNLLNSSLILSSGVIIAILLIN